MLYSFLVSYVICLLLFIPIGLLCSVSPSTSIHFFVHTLIPAFHFVLLVNHTFKTRPSHPFQIHHPTNSSNTLYIHV